MLKSSSQRCLVLAAVCGALLSIAVHAGDVKLIGEDIAGWAQTGDWMNVGAATIDPANPKKIVSTPGALTTDAI